MTHFYTHEPCVLQEQDSEIIFTGEMWNYFPLGAVHVRVHYLG
jgi:hypothetical protein